MTTLQSLIDFVEAMSLYAVLGHDNTCCKCRTNEGEEAHIVLGAWRRFDSFLCQDCAKTFSEINPLTRVWEKGLDAILQQNGKQERATPSGIIERVFRGDVLLEIDRPDEGICAGCYENHGEEIKVILHALGRQWDFYLCRGCMKAFRLTYYKWVEEGTPVKEKKP